MTKRISYKVREVLKDNNLSLTRLAKMLDVSPSTVMRWRDGDRLIDLKNLVQLARVFDFSIDGLFGLNKNIFIVHPIWSSAGEDHVASIVLFAKNENHVKDILDFHFEKNEDEEKYGCLRGGYQISRLFAGDSGIFLETEAN